MCHVYCLNEKDTVIATFIELKSISTNENSLAIGLNESPFQIPFSAVIVNLI